MNTFNNIGFHDCDCHPQIISYSCTLDGCVEINNETGDYLSYDDCLNACSNVEPLCSEYPEFPNTTFTPFPDTIQNLDTAFYGQYYEEYILFSTPSTVGDFVGDPYEIEMFGFQVVNIASLAFDSILFVDIQGLPNSFNYEFSNADGLYFPNTLGCIKISGTALEGEIGNYDLSIIVDGWISVPGLGTTNLYQQSGDFEEYTGYTLTINSSADEECNFDVGTPIVTQPECWDSPNGSVIIDTFVGGIAPYTIKINKNSFLINEVTVDANTTFTESLDEGDYDLEIESSNGCLTYESFQIINPDPFSFSYSIENNDCFNTAPEAHITITGATPPYDINDVQFIGGFEAYFVFEEGGPEVFHPGNSLSWGSSNPLIVTDALGCTSPNSSFEDMFTVNIEPSNPVVVSITTSPVQCADGNNTGFAAANVNGGIPPYEFNWYAVGELAPLNGSNTSMSSMDSLSDGDYAVSVKDVNGCETIQAFTITAPEDIVVNSIVTPPSCVGESDASINIQSVSGGNGGYEYLWAVGNNTTPNANNLSAGIYTVYILEGAQGCEYTETFEIEDPDEISIITNATDESCNTLDDGQMTATFSVPLTDINSIQWYANGLPISVLDGGQSPSLTNIAAGIYNIEITNNNGCLFVAEDTINEPDPIVISYDLTDPSCFEYSDGEFVLTVEGGVGNYNVETLNDVGTTISTTLNPINLIDGTYTVTVTDENGCTASEMVVLNEPNDIILDIELENVSCNNDNDGSATFTPINNQGVGNITWSTIVSLGNYTPLPSGSETVENLGAGNYLLEFVDSVGCEQSETFSIYEPAPIIENIIIGNPNPEPFSFNSYSASDNGNTLQWSVQGGNIIENNGNFINIQWGNQGIGLITLLESNELCDFTNEFTVNIESQVEPTWNCTNNACVDPLDGSGMYDDLDECEADCNEVITDSWNCVNGACVDPLDGSGMYDDLDECEADCNEVITDSWNCVNGACVDAEDGSGMYDDLDECEADCNEVITDSWNCVNGACVDAEDGSGMYDDLDECEADCNEVITDSWNCVNGACVDAEDGSGMYDDLNECEADCDVTSIDDKENEVKIYPNPSSNIFNLEFNSDNETEIIVTNVLGEQVYFESIQSIGEYNTQIDLSNYSKGVYNLTIKTSKGISNYKLILQ